MGQACPPLHPANSESPRDHANRNAAIEVSRRELCELQAHAARLAIAIQSIDSLPPGGAANNGLCDEAFVRGILRARRDRNRYFASHLFADPAWDMLLDLYAAELGQQRVSVTSLCAASNVPTTTALRWISHLERDGLVERKHDPLDARRYFMTLTRKAVEALEKYFAATPRFALSR